LINLILRLEGATEPDRNIDGDIWLLDHAVTNADKLTAEQRHGHIMTFAPQYTKSVDAALTLIPSGPWCGEISWNFSGFRVGGYVELNKANPAWLVPGYDYSEPPHDHAACVSSYDDTDDHPELTKPRPLAIAICIAALRARLADTPAFPATNSSDDRP
jgi:hypothetical protein